MLRAGTHRPDGLTGGPLTAMIPQVTCLHWDTLFINAACFFRAHFRRAIHHPHRRVCRALGMPAKGGHCHVSKVLGPRSRLGLSGRRRLRTARARPPLPVSAGGAVARSSVALTDTASPKTSKACPTHGRPFWGGHVATCGGLGAVSERPTCDFVGVYPNKVTREAEPCHRSPGRSAGGGQQSF